MSKVMQIQELLATLQLMERARGDATIPDPVPVGQDPAVPGLASSGAAPCEWGSADLELVQGPELHR